MHTRIKNVPESIRYFNYPIQALEEAIVNSLYHRDYQQYEPVEISIEPDGIHILSFPGPDRSISKAAIEAGNMLCSRRYRNRRLGDFLKELDLTEGRSTGIPTIQEELQKNGSPRATIETNDERTFINVFIPIHEECGDTVVLNVSENVPENISASKVRQNDILRIVRLSPKITTEEMAQMLHVSRKTISRDLKQLRADKKIRREGDDKGGTWVVIE